MTPPTSPAHPPSLVQALLRDRHFLVAAVLLGLVAAGWNAAVVGLGLVWRKLPVPHPPAVELDGEQRLLSLAKAFGPDGRYRLVEGDGVLWLNAANEPERDGEPDGELVLPEDTRLTLGVGTPYDHARLGARSCNWYVSRIYEDTQAQGGHRYWFLDVTYYTGTLDKVPHVPQRCLVAGGATLGRADELTFAADAPRPEWNADIPLVRMEYFTQSGMVLFQRHQFYTFSLNGRPESDNRMIRLKLANPFTRYSYFAKIQFAPREPTTDVTATTEAAEAFFRAALPEVLKVLPAVEDIEALERGPQ